ncbi:uncharacterized protein LOC131954117 [Physella acuta]|uniref:uncharacterized protein LOC131954117 n=1 Tax=Physella acuta TaxID=109671 RepID=UPI0027DD99BE|nr:uncharacterized protein LOC131954117 [Physella acuta]
MAQQEVSLRFFYVHFVGDKKKMAHWLMDLGFLTNRYTCPKCGKNMMLVLRKCLKDGVIWKCSLRTRSRTGPENHEMERTIRKGTWFETSKLSFDKMLLLTFMWITQWNCDSIIEELQASSCTVTEWTSYCRNVCVQLCVNESEVLGGPGVTVEFYECLLGKVKLPKNKRIEGKWVFGGIEPATAKFFICIVPHRSTDALVKVLKEWIKPGTVVLGDCWNTYNCLEDDEFTQLRDNSSIEFNSLSESQLDAPEAYSKWSEIKKSLSSCQFNIHFFEYIWRQKHKNDPCMFMSFMNGVTNVFPPKSHD